MDLIENKNVTFYHGDKISNIVDKFRNFRRTVESNDRNLKESKMLIDRLKEEVNLLREVEKSLREQFSSAQNRLLQLQPVLFKSTVISEQQRKNQKMSEAIEQKVEELSKQIYKTVEETKNLYFSISKESDLLKNNEDMKLILKSKQLEYDLMKIEIQSLKKEKNELVIEHIQNIKNLEAELEKTKLDYAVLKSQYDKTLLVYKKQIEDNEQIIKEYETERRSLLDEFEPSKESITKVNFTWADSTVSINVEDRAANHIEPKKTLRELEDDEDTEPFLCASYSELKSSFERKSQVSTHKKEGKKGKFETKQKLPLEFLTQDQQSFKRSKNSPELPAKRRLFSTNSNHYIK